MKRNIVLLVIIVVLTSLIFQFEEKRERIDQSKKEFLKTDKYGDLLKLQTPSITIIKKEGQSFVEKSGYQVEEQKLQYFFEILSNLRAERFIRPQSVEEKHFFPDSTQKLTFVFENKTLEFTLGNKLQTSRSFYVKLVELPKGEEKWIVAKDHSPDTGIYSKEEINNSPFQYKRFHSLFYLDESFFHDTRIFKDSNMELSSALMDKTYSLDFINHTTTPAPNGLKIKSKVIDEFKKGILQLRAQRIIYPFDHSKLERKMTTFSLNEGTIKLTLYNSYEGKDGHYLVSSTDKALFEMRPASISYFFTPVQEFWVKKVVEKKLDEFKIEFPTDTSLHIGIKEGQIVEKNKRKLNKEQILKIINLLETEADYISTKRIKKKAIFTLELPQMKLKTYEKNGEVIFYNQKSGMNFHLRRDFKLAKEYKEFLN